MPPAPPTPGTADVRLRPVAPDDHDEVLALNLAEEVMLAPMDPDRLGYLRARADRFDVVVVDGSPAGFVVTMGPGSDYDSPNHRWFRERYGDDFYYLDRIALSPAVRRRGVAGKVYDELEAVASPYGRMALEVNLVPPNPASLAFHTRRGYAEVGRLGDEEHLVVLLTKDLSRDGWTPGEADEVDAGLGRVLPTPAPTPQRPAARHLSRRTVFLPAQTSGSSTYDRPGGRRVVPAGHFDRRTPRRGLLNRPCGTTRPGPTPQRPAARHLSRRTVFLPAQTSGSSTYDRPG